MSRRPFTRWLGRHTVSGTAVRTWVRGRSGALSREGQGCEMSKQTSTSDSSPIRVDFLPVRSVGLPGRIGMTFAPGKKGRGATSNWDRDLPTDLRRLYRTYSTVILVTLLEPGERELLHIGTLLEEAASAGLEVIEFPFRDGGVPASHEGLAILVATILAASVEHRNVTIHCRGGLGRSGLVAAACLLAQGSAVASALGVVRASRVGAEETAAQERVLAAHEAWLRERGTAGVDLPPELAGAVEASKFTGCLLGGALGDALGYPMEFERSWRIILEKFGASRPISLAYARAAPALISDDTQMTLFTAEGLVRTMQRFRDRGLANTAGMILHALVRWYVTQTGDKDTKVSLSGWLFGEQRLHATRAPGNTQTSVRSALMRTVPNCQRLKCHQTIAKAAARSCVPRRSALRRAHARRRSRWHAMPRSSPMATRADTSRQHTSPR